MMVINIKKGMVIGSLCLLAFCLTGFASTKAQLQALMPQVKAVAEEPSLISAVNAANLAHTNLSAEEIRTLGRQWHDGLKGKASQILTEVNASALSVALKNILAQNVNIYEGILVTDSKGLVIGETYNAEHYSQANRSIFRKIPKDGLNAIYYGKAKTSGTDTSATLGLPVIENNKVVGAILVQAKVTVDTKTSREKDTKDTKTAEQKQP